jgi:hypothetical protein
MPMLFALIAVPPHKYVEGTVPHSALNLGIGQAEEVSLIIITVLFFAFVLWGIINSVDPPVNTNQ